MGFDRAEAGVQQKGRLADGHARLAGQTAVGLGHHPGARLFADEHRPDRVSVIVQGVEQRSGIAAWNTKDHIDPGLFKDADNGLTRRNGLVNKRLCHTAFSLFVRAFRFVCPLQKLDRHPVRVFGVEAAHIGRNLDDVRGNGDIAPACELTVFGLNVGNV